MHVPSLALLLLAGCPRPEAPATPAGDAVALADLLQPAHLLFPVGRQDEVLVLSLDHGQPVLAAAVGTTGDAEWERLGPRTWEVPDLGATVDGLLHLDADDAFVLLTLDRDQAMTRRGWQIGPFPTALEGSWTVAPAHGATPRTVAWSPQQADALPLERLRAGEPLGRTVDAPGHHVLIPPAVSGQPHTPVQHLATGADSWLGITRDADTARWRVLHSAGAPPAWLQGDATPPAVESPVPAGRYYVGSGQASGLGWLVLEGGQATPAGAEEPIFALAPLDEHAWRVHDDTAPAGIQPRALVRTGPGELHLAMELSGDERGARTFAAPMRRAVPFPDDLLGDWTLLRPDEGTRTPWTFTRWGEQARVTLGEGAEARTGEVTALGAPEALYLLDHDLGLAFAPMQLTRLGDDALVLVDPYGQWDLLYRGAPPAWVDRWMAAPE